MSRKPVRVNQELTDRLIAQLEDAGIAVPEVIALYVTDTKRGRFCKKNMNITVPVWAVTSSQDARNSQNKQHDDEYGIYYACHEIAHYLSMESRVRGVMHSPMFYEWFKTICPVHLQYYEFGYKPRLAASAGVATKKT